MSLHRPERDGWTERKAREQLADRLSDVRRKGYRRPQPLAFAAYVDETWLPECRRRRGWNPNTEAANRGSIERMRGFFGPLTLGRIRPRDVAAYIADALNDYAPATVNLDVNVLVDVFNSAIREELVETNPALLAERPRIPRRRWRILEPAEVAKVAKAFTDEQMRTLFPTLVLTGIRRFEAQALRWRDVDLVESVLRVRDSKSEDGIRSIALSPALVDALATHKDRSR
jgi:integrase